MLAGTEHRPVRSGILQAAKLDLPPISYPPTRGTSDIAPYYSSLTAQRPPYVSEKLPSLPFPQPPAAYSQGISSPRVSSIASSASSNGDSQSSFTSAPSSNGPKTPSPNLHTSTAIATTPHGIGGYDHYSAMNPQPDMYYQPQHMSAGPATAPQTVTSSSLPQYGHQQPTLLQPGPQYSAPPYPYSYSNGLTSPQSAPPAVSAPMGPASVLPLPGVPNQGGMQPGYQGYDTTGQVAPPGMKPRVTATLWEDEGSLCFQVEARGICVARREGKKKSL